MQKMQLLVILPIDTKSCFTCIQSLSIGAIRTSMSISPGRLSPDRLPSCISPPLWDTTGCREYPQVKHIEMEGNFFIGTFEESKVFEEFYNPEILHLKPWTIDGTTGKSHLVLGSWEKCHLKKLMESLNTRHAIKMEKITKSEMTSIFMIGVRPNLTTKQQHAFNLAIKHGYYAYPRKIELRSLARIAKLSYSTFQAHLRKAEQRILPFSQAHL